MKPTLASLAACLCLMVSAAQAQLTQPIKIQPVQTAPNVGQVAQVDQAALDKARLERENKKLREENAALRQENASLRKQVDDFSVLGGSNVHAYCANDTTSRTTAGAEQSCGGNLRCDPISGMCKTACASTSDCAAGACEICPGETQGICSTVSTTRCGGGD